MAEGPPWLRAMAATLPDSVIERLVLHRGFHDQRDSNERPLENTLPAYFAAWSSGFRLCECDIAVTSDGALVLCHDRNFERLAKPDQPRAATDVTDAHPRAGAGARAHERAAPRSPGRRPRPRRRR